VAITAVGSSDASTALLVGGVDIAGIHSLFGGQR
jgi:hypothetical protein